MPQTNTLKHNPVILLVLLHFHMKKTYNYNNNNLITIILKKYFIFSKIE